MNRSDVDMAWSSEAVYRLHELLKLQTWTWQKRHSCCNIPVECLVVLKLTDTLIIQSLQTFKGPEEKTAKHCKCFCCSRLSSWSDPPKPQTGRLSQRQYGGLWFLSVHLSIRPFAPTKYNNKNINSNKENYRNNWVAHPDSASSRITVQLSGEITCQIIFTHLQI